MDKIGRYSKYRKVYKVDEFGRIQGECIEYCPKGKICMKMNFKDDLKDGLYEEYFSNGKIKLRGFYTKDKRSGVWTQYFDNGVVKCTTTFDKKFRRINTTRYNSKGQKLTKEFKYYPDKMKK